MANKNNKRLLLFFLIFILIFTSFLFWLLDFNSSTNQFTYSKLKNILSKKNISLIKKNATKFIDFNFDLVQKALMANIGVLIGVGAPTSLAIDLANKFDMTLVGFVKEGSFNIYSNNERIIIKN